MLRAFGQNRAGTASQHCAAHCPPTPATPALTHTHSSVASYLASSLRVAAAMRGVPDFREFQILSVSKLCLPSRPHLPACAFFSPFPRPFPWPSRKPVRKPVPGPRRPSQRKVHCKPEMVVCWKLECWKSWLRQTVRAKKGQGTKKGVGLDRRRAGELGSRLSPGTHAGESGASAALP